MGLPVCARLVGAGFEVIASDRDGRRQAEVEAIGAAWADDASGVVGASEVLLTVLPGSPELLDLMTALLPRMRPGTSWIDLTSAAPQAGARLRALAGDVDCLDAPMGGGPGAARAGTLELFVGGEREVLERHRPILDALGRAHHVGEHGAGYLVKLLVNLLWFGQALAAGEAMLLARAAGLELSTLRSALLSSAAESRFIRHDAGRLLEGDYMTDFGLDRCCEELDAIVERAHELHAPIELSSAVRDLYVRALERYGAVDGELLPIKMLEDISGISLS
jgi:3-hydroxyisobutyrate dehydrogenase